MRRSLLRCELFEGLDRVALSRLESIATTRTAEAGERLFVLGQEADRLYVVTKGRVELCLPLSIEGTVKDVCVDAKEAGSAIGWSAFVSPYRFRLSARTAEKTELVVFPRNELIRVFDADPRTGYAFLERLAKVMGERMLTMQALWARELQRSLSAESAAPAAPSPEAPMPTDP